jgi:hypothetical protein
VPGVAAPSAATLASTWALASAKSTASGVDMGFIDGMLKSVPCRRLKYRENA